MAIESGPGALDLGPRDEDAAMSPGEAFAVLGDETRLEILLALGRADAPLAFSELFDRVDYEDSSNFNYHLQQLEGHFVVKTDRGYALRQAGGRIVQAILSGVVTDYPVIERRPAEHPCFLCGGGMEVSYRQEVMTFYCPDCGGRHTIESETTGALAEDASDVVGGLWLPPAGVRNRPAPDLPHAAEVWTVSKGQAVARDVCPWCAASLDQDTEVCEEHEAVNGRCGACNQRFGVMINVSCTNCIFGEVSPFTSRLLSNPDLMAFMLEHGIDPIAPEAFHLASVEEEIHSTDPLDVCFTFIAGGESLELTVGEDLTVVEKRRT